jgi:Ca2+ transporting ATPase
MGGISGLANTLHINPSSGLNPSDTSDINKRKEHFGTNEPEEVEQDTLWDMITEQFTDRTLQILIAAAVVSFILGVAREGLAEGWMDGFGIFIAIFLIVSVTAGNNWMKEQ